jgi:hypothetical protein
MGVRVGSLYLFGFQELQHRLEADHKDLGLILCHYVGCPIVISLVYLCWSRNVYDADAFRNVLLAHFPTYKPLYVMKPLVTAAHVVDQSIGAVLKLDEVLARRLNLSILEFVR